MNESVCIWNIFVFSYESNMYTCFICISMWSVEKNTIFLFHLNGFIFFSYLHSLHIQRFIYFLKVILLFSQVTRNLFQICYLFNHSFYIFWWFSEFNHQKSVKIRILTRSTSIYIIFSFFLVIIFSFLCATSFVISTVNILLRDKCQ